MNDKKNRRQHQIPRTLSRRALLKGALGVGVALPWLELMRPRGIRAQSAVARPSASASSSARAGRSRRTGVPVSR